MEADLVAPATPDVVPPVESTPEPTADASIAEHEAQYGKNKPEPEEPTERPRHRAKSQQANAGDAPRIAELTKKWREAERERDEWKAKASTPPPSPSPVREPAPASVAAPKETPSGKPTWAQFEAKIGETYDTWAAAQDAYADARDDWKDAQSKQARQDESAQQSHQAVQEGYVTRAREFAKTTPDFFEKTTAPAVAAAFDVAPQLLQAAVITDDHGPEIAYYLATHPEVLDELSLLTDGKPVTQQSVALLQRRFSQYRTAAVPTASAPAAPPRTIAPRPPNAVRTGPLKTPDEPPPDDASIAEHEKFYGKRKR